MNKVITCFYCRDEGKPEGCPECGKVKNPSGKDSVVVTPELLEEVKCPIPQQYLNIPWMPDKLMSAYPDKQNSHQFNTYISQLTKMYKIFESGHVPSQSIMIIAPRRMGKQSFAYACMQKALEYGYTVAPLLDTSELKRLNILSADRYFSKELKALDYTIESVVNADVLFMTVDVDNFQGSYRTIDAFVSKRSRRGKPTFILSRYTVEQVSLSDFDDTFSSIVDKTRMENKLKYLGLIVGG